MKAISLIILAALALLAMGCSTTTGNMDLKPQQEAADDVSKEDLLNTLPELPQDSDGRQASLIDPFEMTADLFYTKSSNAQGEGTEMNLAPDEEELCWVMYYFNIPGGFVLGDVEFKSEVEEDNHAWVAVSNYDTNSWEIHGPFAEQLDEIDLKNNTHVSEFGSLYVAVITHSENRAVLAHLDLDFDAQPAI